MNRVRRNVNQLSKEEVDLLEQAFKGIMARDETEDLSVPIDENHPENISYFRLASFHGYITYHCYHQGLQFFHWHRKYMYLFEEALRSVPGCAEVTIPFLEIDAEVDKIDFPDWIWERETFKSYTLPKKLLSVEPSVDYLDYKTLCEELTIDYADGVTTRRTRQEVIDAMKKKNFHDGVSYVMRDFKGFTDRFDRIHGGGHNEIGGFTGGNRKLGNMHEVPLAGFDPIFWFHHSNVERWLWTWENMHGLNSSADYENDEVIPRSQRDEVLNGRFEDYFEADEVKLKQYLKNHNLDYNAFSGSVKEVIDNQIYKIPYEAQTITPSGAFRAFSLSAVEHGPITVAPIFSVLVKDIDRSQIKGSFYLVLTVNGVDHENFIFQLGPACINCQKRRYITSLFTLREQPITLSLRAYGPLGNPLSIGRPKINIRLPLDVAANNDNNIINV